MVNLASFSGFAADIDMQQIDDAGRLSQPNNSIMFRRNAEQYNLLSEEQKAKIEKQRELERQQAAEYERQKAEYERRKAEYERRKAEYEQQLRAQQEAERQRAEELKPIKLYENKLKIYALVNGDIITSTDMESRINAFILTTGIPYNAKTKETWTVQFIPTDLETYSYELLYLKIGNNSTGTYQQ